MQGIDREAGGRVKKGQVIARDGGTGNVSTLGSTSSSGEGKRAADPVKYLKT